VYFFAASALITMLAYGWASTVPGQGRASVAAHPVSPGLPAAAKGPLVLVGKRG